MKVYSAENQIDAQRVADSLLGANIECRVQGGYLSGAIGELPADFLSVWIKNASDYEHARSIVKMIEREALLPHGKPFGCPKCGEQVESQFSHCWNCGSVLEAPG
jgi:uncharacterized protein (UPF0212 family)